MTEITREEGYQMIINDRVPKLSVAYIKSKVVNQNVWADLFTNSAKQCLETAVLRHLSGLGGNIASQVIRKFPITDEVVKECRKKYPAY